MNKLVSTATLIGTMLSIPAFAAEVKIDDLVVATSIPPTQRDATVKAAKTFYEFWNTGNEAC